MTITRYTRTFIYIFFNFFIFFKIRIYICLAARRGRMEAGDRYIYTHMYIYCMYIYIYRAKGYSRLGAALHGKGEWKTAIDAYKMGLELDPENALLKVRDLPDSNTGHYIQICIKGYTCQILCLQGGGYWRDSLSRSKK